MELAGIIMNDDFYLEIIFNQLFGEQYPDVSSMSYADKIFLIYNLQSNNNDKDLINASLVNKKWYRLLKNIRENSFNNKTIIENYILKLSEGSAGLVYST